jgi:hypothetical protein
MATVQQGSELERNTWAIDLVVERFADQMERKTRKRIEDASQDAEALRQFVTEVDDMMSVIPEEFPDASLSGVRRRVHALSKHAEAIEPTLRDFVSEHATLLDQTTVDGAFAFFSRVRELRVRVESAWAISSKKRIRKAFEDSLVANHDLFAELAKR